MSLSSPLSASGRRARQEGATALEILLVLGLLASVMAGLFELVSWQERRRQTSLLAQQASAIGHAMQSYVADHWTDLMATASSTRPLLLTVADLQPKYLPANTPGGNAYRQSICGLILGSGDSLNLLLVTEGGRPLGDGELSSVVQALGAAGGAFYADNSRTGITGLVGMQGGWSLPAAGAFGSYGAANSPAGTGSGSRRCDGSAGAVAIEPGHYAVALWYGKSFNNEGVLYRKDVPGHPELNTMSAPLGLQVDTSAAPDKASFGGGCAVAGQLAADSNGTMLNCKDVGNGLRWGNFYFADPAASVSFGTPCADMDGAYAVDRSGTPLVCRHNVWTSGFPSDAGIVPDGICSVEGATAVDANGRPFTCTAGHWVAFNRTSETKVAEFAAGSHSWHVPKGVTEIEVTMAGGGESGGNVGSPPQTHGDGTPFLAELWPGGSGGFIINRRFAVVPDSVLSIQVGAGGPPQPNWGDPAGIGGGLSAVRGGGLDLWCSGGGSAGSSVAGVPGTCSVMPYGGIVAPKAELQNAWAPGGQTPIGAGSGGSTGPCTSGGSCFPSGAGADGTVVIRWKE